MKFFIFIIYPLLIGCNQKNSQDSNLISPKENSTTVIIGRGFHNNDSKQIRINIIEDVNYFEADNHILTETDSIVYVNIKEENPFAEVRLSSLVGHNDRHLINKGDTLILELTKDGFIATQTKKGFYESNFFNLINKRSIGTNLFFTKFIFKNQGKKPNKADLDAQRQYEYNFLDSLVSQNLIKATSEEIIKNNIDLFYLLNLIKIDPSKYYNETINLRNNILQRSNRLIFHSIFKQWLISELLIYKMKIKQELWETDVDMNVVQEIENSYSGNLKDFLLYEIVTNYIGFSNYKNSGHNLIDHFNPGIYKDTFKKWENNERERLELTVSELLRIDGSTVEFTDIFKDGYIYYIDFWASWCAPCREEFSYSKALQDSLKGQFIKFIYISIDKQKSAWEKASIKENISNYPDNYIIANLNKSEILNKLKITEIPRYLILAPQGKILVENAPRPSDKRLNEILLKYQNSISRR
jgi:thiol-disulfide isomerase/thioredoxin